MESMGFPGIVFSYSFWLLVGVFPVDGENIYNNIPYLYEAWIDADGLWIDAMVLRACI